MKSATHHQGLSEQQVLENRTRYGVNILTPPEKEPLWKQFLEKFSDPIIKILLVALLLSVGVAFYQFFTGTEPASVFLEPAGILAAILLATAPRDYALHRKHFPHTKRLLHQMAQQPLLLQ